MSALLPGVRIDGGDAAAAVDVANVHVPPYGGRGPIADMIVVTAIDLAGPRIAQALAILGSAETVYASPGNLFVASSRYVARDGYGFMLPLEPSVYLGQPGQTRRSQQIVLNGTTGSGETVVKWALQRMDSAR